MNNPEKHEGRPRRYRLTPVDELENRNLGWILSMTRELDARVYDQVRDLPEDGLDYAAPGTGFSIGSLYAHIYWTDAVWLKRIAALTLPGEMDRYLEQAAAASLHKGRRFKRENDLLEMVEKLKSEYLYPAFSNIGDLNRDWADKGIPMNTIGVLAHMLWGKTYHSGQIGLMRLQWGSDYVWHFESV